MLSKFTSRKFIGFIVVLAVGLAVDLLTTRGLSSNFLTLLIALYGGYSLGNLGTQFALSKTAKAPDADITQKLTAIQEAVTVANQSHAQLLPAVRYVADFVQKNSK